MEGSFDETSNRAPRWRFVGQGRKEGPVVAPVVKSKDEPVTMRSRVTPMIVKKMRDNDIIAKIKAENPEVDEKALLSTIKRARAVLAEKTGDKSVLLRPPGSPGSKGNSKKLKTRELNIKKLAEKGKKVKTPAPKNGGVGTSRSGRKVRK
jgi:hypothetical protein